jgi:hypothetical protein
MAVPETLRIVQTVHDTVRDTLTTGVVPSGGSCYSAAMFGMIANIATIVTLVLGIVLLVVARRRTLSHLVTHVVLVRQWVYGPAKAGWSKESITPAIELTWRHPRRRQIPAYSGTPLMQIMLDPNFFVSNPLTQRMVLVTQMIESFNDAIAQYNAFKMSDPLMYLHVERKLDAAAMAMFPNAETYPEDMTEGQLQTILTAANLTPDEEAWTGTLLQMLLDLHIQEIGTAADGRLFHHLEALEFETVSSLWWPLSPPRPRRSVSGAAHHKA